MTSELTPLAIPLEVDAVSRGLDSYLFSDSDSDSPMDVPFHIQYYDMLNRFSNSPVPHGPLAENGNEQVPGIYVSQVDRLVVSSFVGKAALNADCETVGIREDASREDFAYTIKLLRAILTFDERIEEPFQIGSRRKALQNLEIVSQGVQSELLEIRVPDVKNTLNAGHRKIHKQAYPHLSSLYESIRDGLERQVHIENIRLLNRDIGHKNHMAYLPSNHGKIPVEQFIELWDDVHRHHASLDVLEALVENTQLPVGWGRVPITDCDNYAEDAEDYWRQASKELTPIFEKYWKNLQSGRHDRIDATRTELLEKDWEISLRLSQLNQSRRLPAFIYHAPIKHLLNIYDEDIAAIRRRDHKYHREQKSQFDQLIEMGIPKAWAPQVCDHEIFVTHRERLRYAKRLVQIPTDDIIMKNIDMITDPGYSVLLEAVECIVKGCTLDEATRGSIEQKINRLRQDFENESSVFSLPQLRLLPLRWHQEKHKEATVHISAVLRNENRARSLEAISLINQEIREYNINTENPEHLGIVNEAILYALQESHSNIEALCREHQYPLCWADEVFYGHEYSADRYWLRHWENLTLSLQSFWQVCLRGEIDSRDLERMHSAMSLYLEDENRRRHLPCHLYEIELEKIKQAYIELSQFVVDRDRGRYENLRAETYKIFTSLEYPEVWVPSVHDSIWQQPPSESCPICYIHFAHDANQQRCRICRNRFHTECLTESLNNGLRSCPYCRQENGFDTFIDLTIDRPSPCVRCDELADEFEWRCSTCSIRLHFSCLPRGYSDLCSTCHNQQQMDRQSHSVRARNESINSHAQQQTNRELNPPEIQNEEVAELQEDSNPSNEEILISVSRPIRRQRVALPLPPRRVTRTMRPGFTAIGDRIIACRERFGAVVEKENRCHAFYTSSEAGGKLIIDAAICEDMPTIEKLGWENAINPRSLRTYSINWVAIGMWDPFSKRLPKVICHFSYQDSHVQVEKIVQIMSLKRLFGLAIEGVISESICGDNTLSLEKALEDLFGVSHDERVRYWNR